MWLYVHRRYKKATTSIHNVNLQRLDAVDEWTHYMTTNDNVAESKNLIVDHGKAQQTTTVSYKSLVIVFIMELEPKFASMSIAELQYLVGVGQPGRSAEPTREYVAWLLEHSPLFRVMCTMEPGSCDHILSLLLIAGAGEAEKALAAKIITLTGVQS